MKLLLEEPRQKLQLILLYNLHKLAKREAHLWTSENITSFLEYARCQNDANNQLLLLKAVRILNTLAVNSNAFFLFAFERSSTTSGDEQASSQNNENDFQRLVSSLTLHESRAVSFAFCQLATVLLVNHAKSLESGEPKSSAEFLVRLFEATKAGLFSIILQCDREIGELEAKQAEEIDSSHVRYLKVFKLIYIILLFEPKPTAKKEVKIRKKVKELKNLFIISSLPILHEFKTLCEWSLSIFYLPNTLPII